MAVPGLPLGVLCALLVVVVLLGSPHTAAQGALLPAVLPGELYERGLAVRQVTSQIAQLVGFAAGGLLVAAISPELALVVNAVSFAASALLLRWGLDDRPRRPVSRKAGDPAGPGSRAVLGELLRDRRRRALVVLAWLVGCYVVPEALAAPYAQQIGAPPAAVGLLMAADPMGSVLGAWMFFRFVSAVRRARAIGVLAVAAGLPLLFTALHPGLLATVLLWGLSGMASTAYLLQAQASFVRATPDAGRGRAIGVAASGIIAGQGVAVLLGGVLADADLARDRHRRRRPDRHADRRRCGGRVVPGRPGGPGDQAPDGSRRRLIASGRPARLWGWVTSSCCASVTPCQRWGGGVRCVSTCVCHQFLLRTALSVRWWWMGGHGVTSSCCARRSSVRWRLMGGRGSPVLVAHGALPSWRAGRRTWVTSSYCARCYSSPAGCEITRQ